MLDAARHGGFLAVIGEVGSGKSVMRRKVIEQLKRDGDVLVIYPQVIDKERVTAGSICDAIIYDISNEKPKQRLEAKSRQVQRLLLDRSRNGFRHVIILEESHDLSVPVLKYLKRFHELEDGYKKMLGIILVAQTELKSRFTESQNIDMREVIQRVQIAEIHGLNGSLKGYLKVKFERLGVKLDSIFTDDAFDMISSRLTTQDDSRRKVSLAHPLRVNSLVIDAINLAHEMGEERVTGDVIQALY
nr:AAA family ATPase [Desulfuromonas acetoxidans]